ncbi:MAG TPA: hemerythrin domain-containing protein [Casimicrobiaceae bacterium]|nr:hemerythrin domain-containing protein [Casimicrobiaceae bacterium]
MNKSAREVARSLHHYFDDALDFHRNGQEARLFPALLAQVHDADALRVLVATFKNDHRALEGAWETLRASLLAVAFCRPAKLSIDDATGFAAMYRHHVVTETTHLLALGPTASHLAEWVGTVSRRPHRPAYRSQFGSVAAHSDRWWRIDA